MADEEYISIISKPLPTFNPVTDLADFIRRSESTRQQAVNQVEQARGMNSKWIDYSDPVQIDTSPPLAESSSKSPPQKDILVDIGGTSISQDWLVSATGETEGIKTWLMKRGTVYDVTTATTIVVPDTNLTGNVGEVYLMIERNLTTRVPISVTPVLDLITPDSFDQLQYKRIARIEQVTPEGAALPAFTKPIQIQFGDIMLWEDLVVSNGSFKLLTLAAAIGNSYDA